MAGVQNSIYRNLKRLLKQNLCCHRKKVAEKAKRKEQEYTKYKSNHV